MINRDTSVLLIIDLQGNLARAVDQSSTVIHNNIRLVQAAQMLNVPVRFTEQNPIKLGHTINELISTLNIQHEHIFEKMHFDATREAGFTQWLPEHTAVVLTGTEAHVCVLQTAMSLLAQGKQVFVTNDACGSRTKENHSLGMQRLAAAGCTIVSTEMILFEWLETANHPRFRDLLKLIK